MKRRRGFTILEIVVVLLIIAVVTAFTLPAFLETRDEDDITTATQRIELLFQLARDSAVRGGSAMALTIDSASGAVWLLPDRFQPEDDNGDQRDLGGAPQRPTGLIRGAAATGGESLELPVSVSLELGAARARFVFSPAGAAFGDTLWLRTSNIVRIVTLDPWTGHAIVY